MFIGRLVVLAVATATGCSAFQRRAPDWAGGPARMVVLPASVEMVQIDAVGVRSTEPAWALAVSENLDPEVARLAGVHGATPFSFNKVRDCGEPCMSLLPEFLNWGRASTLEIAARILRHGDRREHSVTEWQSRRDFAPLRKALGVDLVLFVVVRELDETAGRVAGRILAAETVGLMASCLLFQTDLGVKQLGAACLARLGDGRMLWCDTVINMGRDLREAAGARVLARYLLEDLWSPRSVRR